jgi:poly-gamma-glutamate synthesis protein (capsule biosynthesis protein)
MDAPSPRSVLTAVGDISIQRDDPGSIFDLVRPQLRAADVTFGQLEAPISRRGVPQVHHRGPIRLEPSVAAALQSSGFNVLSGAGNHCMDYGGVALDDTIQFLTQAGVKIIGVGADLTQARLPAYFETAGGRLALLAYNTILPDGYWATRDRPGCAPVRISTVYEPIEEELLTPQARVLTYARREDLNALRADIVAAREQADMVGLSMHWGLHYVPAQISDYQVEIAHAAIDAGADIILGHHPHILKGIEVYKGKVIFYSLGNFAFDFTSTPEATERRLQRFRERGLLEYLNFSIEPEWISSRYVFPADSRKTMLARCVLANQRIERVSFVPALINREAQPRPLKPDDAEFCGVVEYVKWCSDDQSFGTQFWVDDSEVVIRTDY